MCADVGDAIKACTRRDRIVFECGSLPPVRWQALNRILLNLNLRVLVPLLCSLPSLTANYVLSTVSIQPLISWSLSPVTRLPPHSPDAIDSGSNKTAILACNKLLKKLPNNNLVKVTESLSED